MHTRKRIQPRIAARLVCLLPILMTEMSVRADVVQLKTQETRVWAMKKDMELVMLTDDGSIEIMSHDQDSIRIEITRRVRARHEKEAKQILDDISIDVRESRNRLIMRERHTEGNQLHLLDLLNPNKWKKLSQTHVRVDYRVTLPFRSRLRIKHDEGDVHAENLSGTIFISIDEGDCRLKNIRFQNCRVEIDEGNILLNDMTGEPDSYMRLSCDEGRVSMDHITGSEAMIKLDEGHIRMKQVRVHRLTCLCDEGHISAGLISNPQGKYEFSTSEGDIEIRLINERSIRVALFAEEGRINSNRDLEIRRSDESEQVRMQIGESADTYLKAFTEEGDIRFYQNSVESDFRDRSH